MHLSGLKLIPFAAITLAAVPTAFAEGISTHVLDLASGIGGRNVPVTLAMKKADGTWTDIASARTDENGRVREFPNMARVPKGVYKLAFDMTNYPSANQGSFFPEINVVFQVSDQALHYHVPVVVSPYGYSTYRGN